VTIVLGGYHPGVLPIEAPVDLRGRCLADRYQLTDIIGSGGAGTVWAAQDRMLGRRVAVKDIGAPLWCNVEGRPALRQRALCEARAAAAITHPNVITVYDVVEEDSRPWIVMELIEARTLAQILDEYGPCSPRRVAEIGLQVLAALRAVHRAGILHRDVKPSNVLVTMDGRAVLTDFGIASTGLEAALTATGVLVGAPAYIAPERATGTGAGPASDLWSLGSTLYTAVEGRPPYCRDGALDTISAVVHDEPDPTCRAGVLAPLLAHLLRRDPALRPTP
jgi:serine/threonine protein kinase